MTWKRFKIVPKTTIFFIKDFNKSFYEFQFDVKWWEDYFLHVLVIPSGSSACLLHNYPPNQESMKVIETVFLSKQEIIYFQIDTNDPFMTIVVYKF